MDAPLQRTLKAQLDQMLADLESLLNLDAVSITSDILPGLDSRVRAALEPMENRRQGLAVILTTNGGIAQVVERMVDTTRHFYREVVFIVPDKAMSAGTIFVMSGDRILMDYFSVLGPIDPQVVKDGRLVPGLAYLTEYEKIVERANKGPLNQADLLMLNKLDLAELAVYRESKNLSITLLKKWLTTYKFKDWTKTKGRGIAVTPEMRVKRATEIAESLNDTAKWHSHGRGIGRAALEAELKLQVDDLSQIPDVARVVRAYHELLGDVVGAANNCSFVHSRCYW